MRFPAKFTLSLAVMGALALSGCSSTSRSGHSLPPASFTDSSQQVSENYLIGALDEITVFVWRNNELGARTQVRPSPSGLQMMKGRSRPPRCVVVPVVISDPPPSRAGRGPG